MKTFTAPKNILLVIIAIATLLLTGCEEGAFPAVTPEQQSLSVITNYAQNPDTAKAPDVDTYHTLDIRSVTPSNIQDVNLLIARIGKDKVDTKEELKEVIATREKALALIMAYASDSTHAPAPTLETYRDLSITDVTSANHEAINRIIAGLTPDDVDTLEELLAIVDGYKPPVPDTTKPVITLLGANPQTLTVGQSYTELGATATDDVDGDISARITIDASAVNTAVAGSYTVTYNVSDAAGNAAVQVVRTVKVKVKVSNIPDTTKPVITLLGANPQILTVGQPYTELGATATDDVDGDISARITIDASAVNTAVAGSYTVTYNVSDAAGNAAVQVTRTVKVTTDTTVNYLIITNSIMKSHFEKLAKHRIKTNADISTSEVVTVSWIESTYEGKDIQTKIRRCIQDYYTNKGLKYVVLGGDERVIPVRYSTIYKYPTDSYYAGLDDAGYYDGWDRNGNGIYGEGYGTPNSETDFEADVYVGRIPVHTTSQADAYIDKLIAFETDATISEDFYHRMLIVGERIFNTGTVNGGFAPHVTFDDGVAEYDEPTADRRVSDSEKIARTRGAYMRDLWGSDYTISYLLDTVTSWDTATPGDYDFSPDNTITRINEGWNVLEILVHGLPYEIETENGRLGNARSDSDISTITGIVPVVTTIACLSGAFDKAEPSVSESFLRNPNGGALVYLGSGIENKVESYVPFEKKLYTRIFDTPSVAEAFYNAKQYDMGGIGGKASLFSLNYQGDPAFSLKKHAPGKIEVASRTYTVSESASGVDITFSRVEGSYGTLSIGYKTANRSAQNGVDYTNTNGTLTWDDGDTAPKTITVPIVDDDDFEGNETFDVLVDGLNLTLIKDSTTKAVVTIEDDDTPNPEGVVVFEGQTYSVDEKSRSVQLNVERIGSMTGAVSVDYATHDGTALHDNDYTSRSGTLSWANGESGSKTITIPIVNDSTYEKIESFTVSLSHPSNGLRISGSDTVRVDINDNDSAQKSTLTFSATNYSVDEDSGVATITVKRTGNAAGSVSVDYATQLFTEPDESIVDCAMPSVDYLSTHGRLVWGDGDNTNKTFRVRILDNSKMTTIPKKLHLALSNPLGGADISGVNPVPLTIVDDEKPAGEILIGDNDNYKTIAENSSGTIAIYVARVNGSTGTVSVDYTTLSKTAHGGEDFVWAKGTLTWADGDTAGKTVHLSVIDDDIYEGTETFIFKLQNAQGGAVIQTSYGGSSRLCKIIDNEPRPPEANGFKVSRGAVFASETDASVVIDVERKGDLIGATQVDIATSRAKYLMGGSHAVDGVDFVSRTGTLHWDDGDASKKSFAITLKDDSVFDADKIFGVTLSNPAAGYSVVPGWDATHITIGDNETPPDGGAFSLGSSTLKVDENSGTATVRVWRIGSQQGAVSVDFTTGDSSAKAGIDYMPASGTLDFADGERGKAFDVGIIDNNTFQGSRTIDLNLSNPSGDSMVLGDGHYELTIKDDEYSQVSGSVEFGSPTYTASENGGVFDINVRRVGGSTGAISVDYSNGFERGDGFAKMHDDFAYCSGTLHWADGDTADKIIHLKIYDDIISEGDEKLTLNLENASDYVEITGAQTTVTIADDEAPARSGKLTFDEPAYIMYENDYQAVIRVNRIDGSGGVVKIDYTTTDGSAIAGADYTATSGTLTWKNGDSSPKYITIHIIDDKLKESEETFGLSIAPVDGSEIDGSTTLGVTVVDND